MEKLHNYEQYTGMLVSFKKDKVRYSANKLLTRTELTALIEAGKLYYEEIKGVLWFFSDEEYYYAAHFYVPAGASIHMPQQDMDVLVEVMGNETRYDEQMESKLLAAGFEKHDKYVESACQLEDIIDDVRKQLVVMRKVWGEQNFTCRKAVRADMPELHKLWMEKLGRESYNVMALTDAELEEMERYGRCTVICGPDGKILSSSLYLKRNKICYSYIAATYQLGLGGWASYEKTLRAFEEGCTKDLSWARENNWKSRNMSGHIKKPSGKFYWQFVRRAKDI